MLKLIDAHMTLVFDLYSAFSGTPENCQKEKISAVMYARSLRTRLLLLRLTAALLSSQTGSLIARNKKGDDYTDCASERRR